MSTAASPVPSDRLGRIVLDPCCGHRSFWFDSSCPVAVFGDVREGEWELCDGRAFDVSPDVSMDFTAIPYLRGDKYVETEPDGYCAWGERKEGQCR